MWRRRCGRSSANGCAADRRHPESCRHRRCPCPLRGWCAAGARPRAVCGGAARAREGVRHPPARARRWPLPAWAPIGTCVLLGKGPRLAELLELRDALGLRERVTFLGWIDNPYPMMAAADVFVHPARFEPFGIVYIEALALGIPIVATACPGGPVDVLDNGRFGRLVPPDDPGALADAIVEVTDDRGLRRELAEGGPSRADAYSPASVARLMIRFTDGLKAPSTGPRTREGCDGTMTIETPSSTGVETRSIAKPSAALLAGNVGGGLIAFLFVVTIARSVGPSSRGVVAFVTTVPTVVSLGSLLGLDVAYLYFAGKQPQLRRAIGTSAIVSGAITGVVGALVGWRDPWICSPGSSRRMSVARFYAGPRHDTLALDPAAAELAYHWVAADRSREHRRPRHPRGLAPQLWRRRRGGRVHGERARSLRGRLGVSSARSWRSGSWPEKHRARARTRPQGSEQALARLRSPRVSKFARQPADPPVRYVGPGGRGPNGAAWALHGRREHRGDCDVPSQFRRQRTLAGKCRPGRPGEGRCARP